MGATRIAPGFQTAGKTGRQADFGTKLTRRPSACGNTFQCHRHGRPRLTTPRGQAWVTGTGRSPDFRVIAFFRLPERTNAFSGMMEEAQRLQLRGQSRIWPSASPCSLFIHLSVEPIPGSKLDSRRKPCQLAHYCSSHRCLPMSYMNCAVVAISTSW
ncbi:protein of unknown function [Aminobacter niigataensis]|nr:protein of unknown function [Aminobacter niigataensis]